MRTNYGKLYETIVDDAVEASEPVVRYGTLTAVNSDGLLVMQMKEGGAFEAFKPEEVRIVAPHTISVRPLQGGCADIWETKKGVVEAGDMLMDSDGDFYRVIEIDTDDERGSEPPSGLRKVPSEPIEL